MKVKIVRIAFSLLLLLPAIMDTRAELQAQTRDNASQKSKIICPQCGKENSLDAKFCWNDGYPLAKLVQKKSSETLLLKQSEESEEQGRQPLENLSDAELRLLFSKLSAQYGISQAFEIKRPGFIGDLSEEEFVSLLRNTIRDERIIQTRVVDRKESGFGKFLKSIGVVTLVIMGIGILAS